MSNFELFREPPLETRPVKLRNARDARRFLARIIEQTYKNQMDSGKAAKIGFLIGVLLRAVEVSDMEIRIAKLEHSVTEGERK